MEQIAIIGMACRFPGSPDVRSFWRLLRRGGSAISEVPADRYNVDAVYDPRPATPGKMVTKWGGFLDQVDQFDAAFFGIAPREASRMDPQHRLMMELAWEAVEDAGLSLEALAKERAGVFVGSATGDYWDLQVSRPGDLDVYGATGSARSGVAGRISYALGLRGISVALDTACSSSLVALHLACQCMQAGSCSLALVGGVSLLINPDYTISFSQGNMMAPDGKCKTFDARANGYVRSEGAGVLVLKPLSRALADGDPIHAIIRGTAANNDGNTGLFLTPSIEGQMDVLQQAYAAAGVRPADVHYVEAHGTGTSVGDPVEVTAIGRVLGEGRPADRPLYIGAVKTNIGHIESAAGMAGVIKTALCLKYGEIPANLNFEQPNPAIPWDTLPVRLPLELTPWPEHEGPRLAGVSGFGIAGTNAHIVLEEPPKRVYPHYDKEQPYLLTISAQSEPALHEMARRYYTFLQEDEGRSLAFHDICYTASARRTHQEHRLAVIAQSHQEAQGKLEAFLQGETVLDCHAGRVIAGRAQKMVWVFPGQGSQWVGMGQELFEHEPVFREVIERCDHVMSRFVDWSLIEQFQSGEGIAAERIDIIQPMLFALQIGLAALWRARGLEPAAVVGHSMGEVAAAYVAGILSLEDAAHIICGRSKLLLRTSGRGAMASVELSMEDARALISDYADRVSIAVSNSPNSTVLSGDPAALREIIALVERQNIFARFVKVNVASHSPQMDPLRDDLLRLLQDIQPRTGTVPLYSTVKGEPLSGEECNALYWVQNLREPVLYSTMIQRLAREGFDTFLELSPHPVLVAPTRLCLQFAGKSGLVLGTLRREEPERAALLNTLGSLYTYGYRPDWLALYPQRGRTVALPLYAWQRERFWNENLGDPTERYFLQPGGGRRASQDGGHPLIGKPVQLALQPDTYVWAFTLDTASVPYLAEHLAYGTPLLPASAYIEMALAASEQIFGAAGSHLVGLDLVNAVFFSDEKPQTLQITLQPTQEERHFLLQFLRQDEESKQWVTLGTVQVVQEAIESPGGRCWPSPMEASTTWEETITADDHYRGARRRNITHGTSFQGVAQIWRQERETMVQLVAPESVRHELSAYGLHPALLDACLQAVIPFVPEEPEDEPYLPVCFEDIRFYRHPDVHEPLWVHAVIRDATEKGRYSLLCDLHMLNEQGELLFEVVGYGLQRMEHTAPEVIAERRRRLQYALNWEALPPLSWDGEVRRQRWLIFADANGTGQTVERWLQAAGASAVLVMPGQQYRKIQTNIYEANPEEPETLRAVLKDAFAQQSCQGILYLWGLNGAQVEMPTLSGMQQEITMSCMGLISLVQALQGFQSAESPRLWVVTAGTQVVEREDRACALSQAPLWGLVRVLVYEHPDVHCSLIDLDALLTADNVAALFRELSADGEEDELALRGVNRYAPRLVRYQPENLQEEMRFRADGSYLITGGLGGVGLRLARWMIERGARHLVLVSRRGVSPEVEPALAEMSEMGASVHVARVDVAQEQQVVDLLADIRRQMPPLRGVIHCAVVLNDSTLVQLDRERFLSVMAAKVDGAWNLHKHTRYEPLDFFVLFSSGASLIGSPGQGNYAAANAFIDALAHYRRVRGYPALTINWGRWAEVGQATLFNRGSRLDRVGVASMRAADGLAVFGQMLQDSATQVSVMALNVHKWLRSYRHLEKSSLFCRLLEEEAEPQEENTRSRSRLTREQLQALPPEEQRPAVEAYVCEQIAQVLGLSATRLDVYQQLNRLGIDSLMSVELRNRINTDLQVTVPVSVFLQGITIDQLVTQLI
uniref:Polyketide synthase n=1 Tax=Thermosporothrix sp. COM3 TaxID=2490863 RepID=A0A455SEY6_9CHLR|nr:polyketide synthase [Thermosporothrix sp. COM3]